MGSEVIAKCGCGVEANILVGGGRLDFQTTCWFPCLCENCENIVKANILEKEPLCPECGYTKLIPYDNYRVVGKLGRKVVEWNITDKNLVLTNGNYKCPKCKKTTLTFVYSGLHFD